MRALFSQTIVLCAFLASSAYGNTLPPGPPGSTANDKSFLLTLGPDGSADTRTFMVDSSGFYERDFWSKSGSAEVGVFNANEGVGNKGFSPAGPSLHAFASRPANYSSGASLSGGADSFGANDHGGGSSFDANKNGLVLSGIPSTSGSSKGLDLGFGGDDPRGPGSSDKTVVSATPLPASWTMMLIGFAAFGLLACFRKLKRSSAILHTAAAR